MRHAQQRAAEKVDNNVQRCLDVVQNQRRCVKIFRVRFSKKYSTNQLAPRGARVRDAREDMHIHGDAYQITAVMLAIAIFDSVRSTVATGNRDQHQQRKRCMPMQDLTSPGVADL